SPVLFYPALFSDRPGNPWLGRVPTSAWFSLVPWWRGHGGYHCQTHSAADGGIGGYHCQTHSATNGGIHQYPPVSTKTVLPSALASEAAKSILHWSILGPTDGDTG